MRIIVLLLVLPILLFGLVLFAMWLPLPRPFPPRLSQGRNLMAAVMTGVLGVAYLVGLMVYLISSVRQAGQMLDSALASRGLAARSYWGLGRQYRGLVAGRQVAVTFMPSRALQHTLLDVTVSAELGARTAIGVGKPLLDCRECVRVDLAGTDLQDLQVFGEDERWTRRLLAEPASSALVRRLVRDQEQDGLREVYLQPGQIWMRARPTSQVAEARILQWLDDLLALAEAAEALE